MTATTASSPGDDIIPVKWRTPDNDESEDDALDVHLDVIRAKDRAESTVNSHKRRLRLFIDWLVCHPARDEPKEGPGIELTTELTKRHLQDYFRKRANEGISKKTVETQMYTIKKFLKNLEDYDALSEGIVRRRFPGLYVGASRTSSVYGKQLLTRTRRPLRVVTMRRFVIFAAVAALAVFGAVGISTAAPIDPAVNVTANASTVSDGGEGGTVASIDAETPSDVRVAVGRLGNDTVLPACLASATGYMEAPEDEQRAYLVYSANTATKEVFVSHVVVVGHGEATVVDTPDFLIHSGTSAGDAER